MILVVVLQSLLYVDVYIVTFWENTGALCGTAL